MDFIPLSKAFHDLDGFFFGWFLDLNRLESSLKSSVLFDVLSELVLSRRTDALEFSASEGRLHDVRSINCAFCCAGSDKGMKLVDEEDDLAVRLANFFHNLLHALFEFASILGSGDKASQVEGDDSLVLEKIRNISAHDSKGEAFCNRGLSNTWVADETRVVLGPSAEDLHHALDFVLSTDDGVEFAISGKLG